MFCILIHVAFHDHELISTINYSRALLLYELLGASARMRRAPPQRERTRKTKKTGKKNKNPKKEEPAGQRATEAPLGVARRQRGSLLSQLGCDAVACLRPSALTNQPKRPKTSPHPTLRYIRPIESRQRRERERHAIRGAVRDDGRWTGRHLNR